MILLIAPIAIFLLKSLDLLYLFQTKEYRLDRILNFLKEEGVIKVLYFRKIRMPALSLRNLLIAQGIFFNIIPFYLIFKNFNSISLIISIMLSPVIALLMMLLGVLLSEIPVQLYRKFIIYKAIQKVKNSQAVFIGITGSYGKTSSKEFLYQILSQKYKIVKTEKNYNSDVGVALSVLKNLKPETQFFIAELGAYRKGEIKAACKIIQPRYGILTGIGNQHLALFGSQKNLLEAKAELLQSLPKQGKAYINKDIDDWQFFADKTTAEKSFFSVKDKADTFLQTFKQEDQLTIALIKYNDVNLEIKTKLLGLHNLQNLLPCISLASDLGVEENKIIKAIGDLKPIKARLSIDKGIKRSAVLDDSYNSNTEGFIAAISLADSMDYKRKIIISRGLIELGSEKSKSYQEILNKLYQTGLQLLTTDKLFIKIDSKNKVKLFQNEKQMLDYIRMMADKNTLIIIEGRFEPKTIEEIFAHSQKLAVNSQKFA